MAVDFSLLPGEVPVPERVPSPFVWSIVFVGLTLAGIALALWSWPRSTKTQTLWFWLYVVVIPVCLAGAFVLRRFSSFHQRRDRALADNRIGNAYIDMVFNLASVPLAVLAVGYRLHVDDKENTFDAIVARSACPPTRTAKESHEMLVASCLEPAAAELAFDDQERQRAVLEWILRSFLPSIVEVLGSVPERIPVEVYLDVSSSVLPREAILRVWEGLPASVRPSRLNVHPMIEPTRGLWLVDTMLDRTIPELRNVVTVLISANLSPLRVADPEPGSAEAAAMMLLCPATLAREEHLPVAGWFHRPQADASAPPGTVVHYALKWGNTASDAVGGTIQAGFDERTAVQLRVALGEADRPGDERSLPILGLDTIFGNVGATAPWLAAALALDRAIASKAPYIVDVKSEEQTLLAVLAPPGHHARKDVPTDD